MNAAQHPGRKDEESQDQDFDTAAHPGSSAATEQRKRRSAVGHLAGGRYDDVRIFPYIQFHGRNFLDTRGRFRQSRSFLGVVHRSKGLTANAVAPEGEGDSSRPEKEDR